MEASDINYNVFIAYRGDSSDNKELKRSGYDSKYIGASLYYELSSAQLSVFFAPRRYIFGDNFLNSIEKIMSSVVDAHLATIT